MWKNFEELEESISMPELLTILDAKRKSDDDEHRFLAAMQGIDLDKDSRNDEWEEMKNRVFNKSSSSLSDITSLQGANAYNAGFGIGNGLDYEVLE